METFFFLKIYNMIIYDVNTYQYEHRLLGSSGGFRGGGGGALGASAPPAESMVKIS